MILDTAGMQHSASSPDLDPAALEAAGISVGGLASSFAAKSRLGPNTGSQQQHQQQQQSSGGGGVVLKSREASSGDGGGGGARVSLSSCGSSQQLLQQQGGLGYRLNVLRVDGGATNNNLLMQLQVGIRGVCGVRAGLHRLCGADARGLCPCSEQGAISLHAASTSHHLRGLTSL